jgi:hypothetical protein
MLSVKIAEMIVLAFGAGSFQVLLVVWLRSVIGNWRYLASAKVAIDDMPESSGQLHRNPAAIFTSHS